MNSAKALQGLNKGSGFDREWKAQVTQCLLYACVVDAKVGKPP